MQTADGQENSRRDLPTQPRGADGRFGLLHGAYSAQRVMRRSDRRRAPVRQKEALRNRLAMDQGHTSWDQVPEPDRGLFDLAAEVRIIRRLMAAPVWKGQTPAASYLGFAELERRLLVAIRDRASSQPYDWARELQRQKDQAR